VYTVSSLLPDQTHLAGRGVVSVWYPRQGHRIRARLPAGFDKRLLDPCHGSLFSLDGLHLTGPGHRGLNRFPVGYLPDGSVVPDLTGIELSAPSP
jgi:hypothetical protein